jgi:hypothetical protein
MWYILKTAYNALYQKCGASLAGLKPILKNSVATMDIILK